MNKIKKYYCDKEALRQLVLSPRQYSSSSPSGMIMISYDELEDRKREFKKKMIHMGFDDTAYTAQEVITAFEEVFR